MRRINRKTKNKKIGGQVSVDKTSMRSHEVSNQEVTLIDYELLFLQPKEFKDRKAIYISQEMHQKIAHIAEVLMDRGLSIGAYVENVMVHHFEMYKDEINALYGCRTQKPL